jgi:alkyldihydroxyacetonephosphate synthase
MTTKRPKLIGWGFEGDEMTEAERAMVMQRCIDRFGGDYEIREMPVEAEIELHRPRLEVPSQLAEFATTDDDRRMRHTYGMSFTEYVRIFDRDFTNAPDIVAHPRSEADIEAVFEWAAGANVAVIPWGGGTSSVRGLEPDVGGGFAGTLSVDLTKLDKVLEIDKTSRAVRVQGGMRVAEMEAELKPHGLTLRHFPQSFEMASIGGMIATRSGGHFATLYTHIDDFVESLRMVTPVGAMESRRLPGSGAGPSPDRMMIGSEGSLGIITEAWLRLQDRPTFRAGTAVLFDDFVNAVEAVRIICQASLYPANVRLLDPAEARNNGFGDGKQTVVVLAFENADHPVDVWMDRALEIARDLGGRSDESAANGGDGHRDGAAGAWRNAFIRMPHFKTMTMSMGIVGDTFETAITWERFPAFYENMKAAAEAAIEEATGQPGTVSCRFTHCYPDGPAPYFTFQGRGRHGALIEQWRHIKTKTLDAVIEHGGTVTHHHAIGRAHMPWYNRQMPETFIDALAGAKSRVDPNGILNPGVLLPARGA